MPRFERSGQQRRQPLRGPSESACFLDAWLRIERFGKSPVSLGRFRHIGAQRQSNGIRISGMPYALSNRAAMLRGAVVGTCHAAEHARQNACGQNPASDFLDCFRSWHFHMHRQCPSSDQWGGSATSFKTPYPAPIPCNATFPAPVRGNVVIVCPAPPAV